MTQHAAARAEPPQQAKDPVDQRRHPRIAVQYRLRYSTKVSGKTIRGEGMLVDVSISGCGIQGSCPVKQGAALVVEIQVPKTKMALRLEGVRVMWASGSRFGVTSEECAKIVSQLELLPPGLTA
ncbi:hypothetical protein YTPLAS18_38940 [Nitrospira sp.]|nr:hypothetical protein YTPLAS18_38940 [Nitrospira sp.]